MKRKSKIILFVGLMVYYVLLAFVVKPTYQTNDDWGIRYFVEGANTGNVCGYAVFMHYILASVLSFMYIHISAGVPWYGLYFFFIFVISSYIVVVELIENVHKDNKKFDKTKMLLSVLALLIFSNLFIMQQFTISAGIIGGTALFCIIKRKNKFLVLALMILCYMTRSEIFLLATPFWILSFLITQMPIKKKNVPIKKICAFIGTIIIIYVACFTSNQLFYMNDKYEDFLEISDARSYLYDYTNIQTNNEQVKKAFEMAGYDATTYNLVRSYDLALDYTITKDDLTKMKDITVECMPQKTFLQKLFTLFDSFKTKTFILQTLLICILYILGFIFLYKSKQYQHIFLLFLCFIGKWFIIFFLNYFGRNPERVWTAIWIMECMFLYAILSKAKFDFRNGRIVALRYISIAVMIICVSFMGVRSYSNCLQVHNDIKEFEIISTYCQEHPQNEYFCEAMSGLYNNDYTLFEKLTDANMYKCAGWSSHHPILKQMFKTKNCTDLGDYLYKNDNAYYLISRNVDTSWLEDFFHERYGDVSMKIVDTIECSKMTIDVYTVVDNR